MTTLDLFLSAPPIPGKRRLSRKAAKDTARRSGNDRLTILRWVSEAPAGLTRDALSALGMGIPTVTARCNELVNAKGRYHWRPLLTERGERLTRSGSRAAVLFLTKAGRDLLQKEVAP